MKFQTPSGQFLRGPVGGAQIHAERVQISIVHPDDPRAGLQRHVQFPLGVHLHERLHVAFVPGVIDQFLQQGGRRHGDDEEDGIGSGGGGLGDLILIDDEILAEYGGTAVFLLSIGGPHPRLGQIVQRSLEPSRLGQYGNDRRAGSGVNARLIARVQIGSDVSLGRAGSLEFGREAHGRRSGAYHRTQIEGRAVGRAEFAGGVEEVGFGGGVRIGLDPFVIQNPHRGDALKHAQFVIVVHDAGLARMSVHVTALKRIGVPRPFRRRRRRRRQTDQRRFQGRFVVFEGHPFFFDFDFDGAIFRCFVGRRHGGSACGG
mmetsp:Transcript_38565/g.115753  ORF Transcript_38565/g.115753 Transcript_38565/m.115753 type:complete len:316 (+) Transcript_38565:1234-2181(+)